MAFNLRIYFRIIKVIRDVSPRIYVDSSTFGKSNMLTCSIIDSTESCSYFTPDDFRKVSVIIFSLAFCLSGKLKRIHIWHDGSGYNPGWYLEAVEINDKGNNKEYYVNCNTWLEGENPSITIDL